MKNPKLYKQLRKKWLKAQKDVSKLDMQLRELETNIDTVQRIVNNWPKWKRDVQIGKINGKQIK